MTQANTFLQGLIPLIMASPAYRDRGLIIVTFDEAETDDASACCGEQPGPNTAAPGLFGGGPGGGRVGAVMLSDCIRPGTVSTAHTTTTACCARSRTTSACLTWATRDRPGCGPSAEDILNRPGIP